ncbi:hypothetical protein HAX54_034802 [Datura stramonium]|uniref:Uncharacterized protein n=1 Tax=Datura stramonium TaxID=4076 RepID=A0ABS8SES4_DATST|nr:hypothetical protein [Datura stramonium]
MWRADAKTWSANAKRIRTKSPVQNEAKSGQTEKGRCKADQNKKLNGNLDNVELTEAQFVVVVAATTQNAQQRLRNQPPFNRRAPPIEDLDLEQTGYAGAILLPELGGNAKSMSPAP